MGCSLGVSLTKSGNVGLAECDRLCLDTHALLAFDSGDLLLR